MKKQLIISAIFFLFTTFSFSQNFVGNWTGNLNLQGTILKVVFHVANEEGILTSTLDSPDQNSFKIPVKTTIQKNDSILMDIEILKGSFKGKMTNSNTIDGIFKQNTSSFPLLLEKSTNSNVVELKKDKSKTKHKVKNTFSSNDVEFYNTKENIKLSGTLTIPKGKGTFPAVILVSGSGPQNRDEELMGLKPFETIATYLSNHGIAVLRYDDRGTAKSEGNFSISTFLDFSYDAEAAFEFLKSNQKFKSNKIGIIGHSEGGMIAPMVASRNKDVAFIISLAGPGIPISDLMLIQHKLVAESLSFPEKEIESQQKLNKELYEMINTVSNEDSLKVIMKRIISKNSNENGVFEDSIIDTQIKALSGLLTPWFKYFIRYNPQPIIELVKCPVLALNGEKDIQVSSKENLDGFKFALDKGGNINYKTFEFKQMNHMFQTCESCKFSEYSEFDYSFSEDVLKMMSEWISKQ